MKGNFEQPQIISPESIETLKKLLEKLEIKWKEQGVTLQARYDSYERHGDHIYLATLEKKREPEGEKTSKGFQAMAELCVVADMYNLPIYLIFVPKMLGVDKFFEHFGFHHCECWECCSYLVRKSKING